MTPPQNRLQESRAPQRVQTPELYFNLEDELQRRFEMRSRLEQASSPGPVCMRLTWRHEELAQRGYFPNAALLDQLSV